MPEFTKPPRKPKHRKEPDDWFVIPISSSGDEPSDSFVATAVSAVIAASGSDAITILYLSRQEAWGQRISEMLDDIGGDRYEVRGIAIGDEWTPPLANLAHPAYSVSFMLSDDSVPTVNSWGEPWDDLRSMLSHVSTSLDIPHTLYTIRTTSARKDQPRG